MKKKIISVLLTLSLLGLNMTTVYAQEEKFDPYSDVWKNKNAKEWGDTPLFVRVMVERISEKSKKIDTISPFSIIWLKQVVEDKKAYNLSDKEVEWIENTLIKTAKEKKSEWQPEILAPQTENKAAIASKETVNDKEKSVVVQNEKLDTTPVLKEAEKEEVKNIENPVKPEDGVLKDTVLSAKEDMKAINKEAENPLLKEKTAEIVKPTIPVEVKKQTEKNGKVTVSVAKERVSQSESIYNVPSVKIAKVMPDINNSWVSTVLKQLGVIVIFLSFLMVFITRNSKYRISNK